jgi:hypothetical protein
MRRPILTALAALGSVAVAAQLKATVVSKTSKSSPSSPGPDPSGHGTHHRQRSSDHLRPGAMGGSWTLLDPLSPLLT